MEILLSITTTEGADWETRVKEINELELKEVALFPTCLNQENRKKLYQLIEKSSIKSIPLVHIRSDMPPEELDYLVENYNTKVFCAHTRHQHPWLYDYPKYRKIICIENVYHPFDEKELKNLGGICLDLGHLANDELLNKKRYTEHLKTLKKYPLLANHVSALKRITRRSEVEENKFSSPPFAGAREGEDRYDFHRLGNLSELDYLKKYPPDYFSSLVAIELENSIQDQLKVRNYIYEHLRHY